MTVRDADPPSSSALAVIGLGLMGSRIASRLASHGYSLHGYDPDPERVSCFASMGGAVAGTPAEAVQGCEIAILSLPDSTVSTDVCLGEGGLAGAGIEGLVAFDTTTGRPSDAVTIAAALGGAGVIYCDTTLSGNAQLAERGELVVMMGGPASAYEKGIPVFEAIGRSHHRMGEVGSGATMKLLVNQALSIHRMALAETLTVAEMAGLDLDVTLEVLRDSLAYSKAMDVWGGRMVSGEHEPPFSRLRQSSKDARLIVEHGHEVAASIPLIEAVAAALAEGEAGGLADMDNSAIVEVVRRRAGIGTVPIEDSERE